MPTKDQVFVANTSGTVAVDPDDPAAYVMIQKDVTRVRGDDPILRKFSSLFDPAAPSRGHEVVEEATAKPGVKRGAESA